MFCNHNHDRLYASKSHKHDDRYSLLGHVHDTLYSLLGHTHEGTSRIVGEITIWATDTAPTGWLLCYGQTVLRSTALGTLLVNAGCPFGTGDGSTTVNLPDFRGRMPLGQDDMGGSSANRVTNAQADTIGGNGGAETITLQTTEIPAHTHPPGSLVNFINYSSAAGSQGLGAGSYSYGSSLVSGSTGGGGAHNNMPPWLTINFIIYSG
jgi:microcystin-dependent protein